MNCHDLAKAIDEHITSFELFVQTRTRYVCELAALTEREYTARQVLVESRGDDKSAEIRRATYMAGFLLTSRVCENDRLLEGESGGKHSCGCR